MKLRARPGLARRRRARRPARAGRSPTRSRPSPLARQLRTQPRRAAPARASTLVALVARRRRRALAVCWLAALGVRERRLLERAAALAGPRAADPPGARARERGRLSLRRRSVAFALLEATIHWRAGLGWHGLHCLVGPVHRDAAPDPRRARARRRRAASRRCEHVARLDAADVRAAPGAPVVRPLVVGSARLLAASRVAALAGSARRRAGRARGLRPPSALRPRTRDTKGDPNA